MLPEKLLKQVAEEFALAMNESLPKPEQCQHQFSEEFERKMQRLLSAVPINTQIVVVVPELSYNQTYELQWRLVYWVSLYSVDSQFKNCENHNVIILIIVILILSFPIRNGTGMIRCNITNVEAVVCLYCRKFFRYLI